MKETAGVPQIFDLRTDPQDRYELFMTTFTENIWTLPIFNQAMTEVMKSFDEYPPRKLQSDVYTGSMSIARFRRVDQIKELLKKGH